MDLWFFMMELTMLLGSAFALGALAQRLKQNPIIGYLLAGTIIGPLLFNADAVSQSAELGVSLLLFSIGLEFSFDRLKQAGRLAMGGGSLQVAATLGIVCLLLISWYTLPQAITIGAIISLSSTAVVMRILVDRSEIDSVRGRSCLAILLQQDLAVVPLVLMVSFFAPQESTQTNIWLHIVKVIASAGGLGLVLYLLLYKGVPVLLSGRNIFANRELMILLAITIGLGASWGAHALGISPALGAFVAGLLLGESPFATQIRSDIGVARTIMVTLFFASIGMLAKPLWILMHLHWIVAVAISIFILKALIMFSVGRIFGLNNRQSLATGITLAQVGEFSFVLAATAEQGGLLTGDQFDLMVSVIIALMFAAPYMVSKAFPLTDRILNLAKGRHWADQQKRQSEKTEFSYQIMVVGLGPAGQEVVRHLIKRQYTPLVIDINPQSRVKAFELGIKVHLGDAVDQEVLIHAGLVKVCMAVITLPDPAATLHIIEHIRQLRPELPIAVRCRHNRHIAAVMKAGATITVDEETHTGHELSHKVMEFIQTTSGEALACRLVGRPAETEVSNPPKDTLNEKTS